MRRKRLAVLLLCMSFLLSLFGCGKQHLVDGPGMVNTLIWESFEISRSDSYYQYNFWFALKFDNGYYLLTGECSDEDGNTYISEDGIKVSYAKVDVLREKLALDDLPDKTEDAELELLLLDAPSITLTLTYADGSQKQKSIGGDTSMDIYDALLPYFINN